MGRQLAFVTPELARWARERAGVSPENVARQLNRTPEEIESWERPGSAYPTIRQAQKLASYLRIPFGYLFLPVPPSESLPLPDFRIRRSATPQVNIDLLEVIDDAIIKQDWYRSYLIGEEAEPSRVAGRFRKSDPPQEVSRSLRSHLDMDSLPDARLSQEEYLRILAARAESAGILVMRSGIVRGNTRRALSADDFQGFAINDSFAPLVFINTKDYAASQTFTLAHELAHIAIGESGVSRLQLESKLPHDHETELQCNRIAADFLVPIDGFLGLWDSSSAVEQNVTLLRKTYHVSSLVILRRAFDLGRLSWETYSKAYSSELAGIALEKKRRENDREDRTASGNFYSTLPARNSRTLTRAVLEAVANEKLDHREAAHLLGVKIGTLSSLIANLLEE